MNHSMVSFNIPPCVGSELTYVKQAMDSHKTIYEKMQRLDGETLSC